MKQIEVGEGRAHIIEETENPIMTVHAISCDRIGVDSEDEGSLHGQVHDHQLLGSELVG